MMRHIGGESRGRAQGKGPRRKVRFAGKLEKGKQEQELEHEGAEDSAAGQPVLEALPPRPVAVPPDVMAPDPNSLDLFG